MKNTLLILFIAITITYQVSAQSDCRPVLDEINSLQNNYRDSPTFSLANLSFTGRDNYPFFDGDGNTKLFDLGFAKGIWAGGFDPSGNLKLAASGYGTRGFDFMPGPIWRDFQANVDLCEFFRRVWTIEGTDLALLQNRFQNGELSINNIPIDILEWPAKGNPHIEAFLIEDDLAPFFDYNQDSLYDPLDGDSPIALSETPSFIPSQFRFYVYNDMTVHQESGGEALDMEF